MSTRFTRTRIGRILLPAIIFQSVGIGGAFATGREIVEYFAQFGRLGVLAIAVNFVAMAVSGVLLYEVARTFGAYDYKTLMQNIVWKFWPVLEVLYIVLAIIFISALTSAGGIILEEILGVPVLLANTVLLAFIFGVLYFGRSAIERFSTVGTVFIYLVYIGLFAMILTQRWDHVVDVLATGTTAVGATDAAVEQAGAGAAVSSALTYAGYSLIIFMPVLFLIDRLETRREAVLSGLLSSALLNFALVLTYLCLLGFYPDESVMGAPVPWLVMIEETGGTVALIAYSLVIGLTFVETGVGYTHSITERINRSIRASENRFFADTEELSSLQRGLIAAGVFLSALVLSRIGIIALVSQAYSIMAYLFIVALGIPLLTVGLLRVLNPGWKRGFWESA